MEEEKQDPILVQYIKDRIENKNKNFVMLFCGATGCLSGDTLIRYSKLKSSKIVPLRKLYKYYHNPQPNKNKKRFDITKPISIRAFNGKEIKLHKFKDVFYSGKKQVYELLLEDGKFIKATPEHKILTSSGWKELIKLKVGDLVLCDTPKAEKKNRKRIKLRDISLKVDYHPYKNPYNNQVEVHRLIYEARLNNLEFLDFLDILLNEPEKSKKLKFINIKKYLIHHKDGCHYNNSVNNLQLMTYDEHKKLHGINNYKNFSQGIPKSIKVKKIIKRGIEDVYDIECEEPYHNFIANDIIVHNSGKSYSALRLAEMLDDTFDIERVKFRAKDFMNCINDLVKRSEEGEMIKGKVILWDEFGVEHNAREFMTISNRVINYFFQTSRHLNLIVIMTVPLLSFIDSATRKLMHGIAEMQGINSSRKTASVKVKMLQTNVMTGKEYPKYLRYRKKNKMFVSKRLRFKLPSKKLLEDYEKKKKEFTTMLNKEIMNKLLKSEEKDNKPKKTLTDMQEKVGKMLLKNSVDEVANKLGVGVSTIYAHKTNMEKKGYKSKPVWKDHRIICWEIEGLVKDENVSKNKPQV